VLSLMLTACGNSSQGDKNKREAPVTALIMDVSGSTKDLRKPGGQFDQDWMVAAQATAEHRGTLWATTADSQTVKNSIWVVRGLEFKPTITDNNLLAKAELRKKAQGLAPQEQQMLRGERHSRSDLLGGLAVAARLFQDYPDRPRDLVFLTDGGINVGTRDLGYDPPLTARGRRRVVAQLRHKGLVPNLKRGSTPVRVWLGGIGHGVGGNDPRRTIALIKLWRALIPATGAKLVSEETSLNLIEFP
jgi:hypothetical protein